MNKNFNNPGLIGSGYALLKPALVLVLLFNLTFNNAQMPFSRGVNLPLWFQATEPGQIQFGKFIKKDFENIQSLGCDVIRVPVSLLEMTGGEPEYTIDPLFYYFMDEVVSWAEDLGISLILDNVAYELGIPTPVTIGDPLIKIWTQVASHYKDRSTKIFYEVQNEPHQIDAQVWDSIQQEVITAIRAVDTIHTIIVGPVNWNSYHNLDDLSEYPDNNLIYTFHFYDPLVFTHQGATWIEPPLVSLSGVPFPYDAGRMPDCPADLSGTWVEGSLLAYPSEGTEAFVQELIDIAGLFKTQRNVRVYCGELGVSIHNAVDNDRLYWHNRVRSFLEENGIAWSIWAYNGIFGLFEEGSNEMFEYDLNIPLIETLGLTVPGQQEYVLRPDSMAFDIYKDYITNRISESSIAGSSEIGFYSDEAPKQGDYCISWSDASLYNTIGFDFKPDKDLSYLVDQGYNLNCWLRGSDPDIKFDIRFLDSKTTVPGDHPWRMGITVDATLTDWNGQWQNLKIPLKDFVEKGSWDIDTWYNPVGAFEWTAADRLEIVAEHMDLTGIDIYLDDISITAPEDTTLTGDVNVKSSEHDLFTIYPNPTHGISVLGFRVINPGLVDISIYNVSGQLIKTVVHDHLLPGNYQIDLDIENGEAGRSGEGIYFCRMVTSERIDVRKLIKIK
jgi:endoglucanase